MSNGREKGYLREWGSGADTGLIYACDRFTTINFRLTDCDAELQQTLTESGGISDQGNKKCNDQADVVSVSFVVGTENLNQKWAKEISLE